MTSLVACTCGHGVEAHTKAGCPGTSREKCICPRTAHEALDAAVAAVRSTYQADREALDEQRSRP